jgi:glycosyltransferase involved in cell wall biosynthesis
MKFTVIGPVYPYRGGIAHYTAQLIKALSDANHMVFTVSYKRQYPKWLYPGKSDKDPSQSATHIGALYLLDPLNPITWYQTAKQIDKTKPDLVIIQWWTTFWAPAYAGLGAILRWKKIKVGYIIHNVFPHEQHFFDSWLSKLALSKGNVFLAQTEGEKQKLQKLLPRSEVVVSNLPTYTFLTTQQISKEEARIKIGFPLNRPLILFFGIVRAYKGLKYLIDSMALMKRENSENIPFLLVAGEIWEDKSLFQEQIERLDLKDCVQLDDRYIPDEEAAIIFSAADMLVAPYIDGTQSAAVGLALGFGLPLIVTEIVADGIAAEKKQNIQVVKAGDANAISQAIKKTISNPEKKLDTENNGEEDWKKLVIVLESLA